MNYIEEALELIRNTFHVTMKKSVCRARYNHPEMNDYFPFEDLPRTEDWTLAVPEATHTSEKLWFLSNALTFIHH